MNNINGLKWWAQQGKQLAELEDRVYFIFRLVYANFGEYEKIYKIFDNFSIHLAEIRIILDDQIIIYFPNSEDYIGNIRNLTMFKENIYKKAIYPNFDLIKKSPLPKKFTDNETIFVIKFINDLKRYIDYFNLSGFLFTMTRKNFEKMNAVIKKIRFNLDQIIITN